MLAFGDSRRKESHFYLHVCIIVFISNMYMNLDSSNVSADEFREYVWLSIADLIGIAMGSIL